MATLTFSKDNQELIKYVLRQDSTSIGRSSSADICIPDSNVSRTHFIINFDQGRFTLIDKSTNGTFISGKRVVKHDLKDSDKIEMGEWRVVFSEDRDPIEQTETRIIGRDPTEVLNYDPKDQSLTCRRAVLEYVGLKKSPFIIKKEIVSIGKSSNNDIVISGDKYVSNHHCKIENRGGRIFVKDLQSTNGTFLNDIQIVETAISEGNVVKVGQTKLRLEYRDEKEKLKPLKQDRFHAMVGTTEPMQDLFAVISRVAHSDATVLIQGETGTGKELVAKAIHQLSHRSPGKLISLNCSAIAKDLIESELFGHEKGAFTSAHQQRKGAFEAADRGTLFLDEIGDMPLELQPKLLRVLENREITRLGSNSLIDVDVRVIAATNKDLAKLVKEGRFRQDLYYRLFVVPITIPPLRERVEDIPVLAEQFLIETRGDAKNPQSFSDEAVEKLISFSWPGNVRELKNTVSRAVMSAKGSLIEAVDLNFSPVALQEDTKFDPRAGEPSAFDEPKTLRDYEREKILKELDRNSWNKKQTAEKLGISKTTLFEKIKKYGLKQEGQG